MINLHNKVNTYFSTFFIVDLCKERQEEVQVNDLKSGLRNFAWISLNWSCDSLVVLCGRAVLLFNYMLDANIFIIV